jgi:hypothetical protein
MKMKVKSRPLGAAVLALLITAACAMAIAQPVPQGKTLFKAQATAFAGPLQTEQRFNRLIIRFKDKATTRAGVFDFFAARNQVAMLESSAAMKLGNTHAAGLSYLKSVNLQNHLALTGQKLSRAELFALAKQIEQDPSVAYAEIDELIRPLFTPNDPYYGAQ